MKRDKPFTDYLTIARRTLLLEESLKAVYKIAKGHPNPTALCQVVLAEFPELKVNHVER